MGKDGIVTSGVDDKCPPGDQKVEVTLIISSKVISKSLPSEGRNPSESTYNSFCWSRVLPDTQGFWPRGFCGDFANATICDLISCVVYRARVTLSFSSTASSQFKNMRVFTSTTQIILLAWCLNTSDNNYSNDISASGVPCEVSDNFSFE